MHSSREYQALKALLRQAANLSELFISFDNLLATFDDAETCELLSQRIRHLLILRSAPAAPTQCEEKSLVDLLRVFRRLRHFQIDVTHGPSLDSIVLVVLRALQNRSPLISLVVEGECLDDALKVDARRWLIDRGHFRADDSFDAQFKEQTKRFLLWTSNGACFSSSPHQRMSFNE